MARGLHVLLRVQRLDSAATAPTIALRSVCCWLDVSPTIILRAEAELLLEWAARLVPNCYVACAANHTGCSCFEHIATGPDDNPYALTANTLGTTPAKCRLHASVADIVTNQVSDYTAYWHVGNATADNLSN